jgi:hypothetical protein
MGWFVFVLFCLGSFCVLFGLVFLVRLVSGQELLQPSSRIPSCGGVGVGLAWYGLWH